MSEQETVQLALNTMHDIGMSYEDMATELGATRPTMMTWFKSPDNMPLGSYLLLKQFFLERRGNIELMMGLREAKSPSPGGEASV